MATLKISSDLKNVIKKVVLDTYFPVGSLYLTVGSENPNTTIGGTWTKLSGYYLYADTSINNTRYTGKGTQGHKLTQGQLPRITGHIEFTPVDGFTCNGAFTNYASDNPKKVSAARNSLQTTWGADLAFGNNESHSHNIATKGIYVWQRTK